MIQFSKPRRPFNRNEGSNRFEHNARDVLNGVNGSNERAFLLLSLHSRPC